MILVDTSVLIGFFRGHSSPAIDLFASLERQQVSFAVPLHCVQEVLQGARDEREWRTLVEYLEPIAEISATVPRDTHREAARIYFECRRMGITLRSTIDCLIAQLAIEHRASLLHDDGDFERIRRVRPQLQTLRG